MPRQKIRTPELRAHILAEALIQLEDAGLSGFTTRRIAQRAKTSPPAIYELFGDKEGLLRAVFFEGFGMLGRLYASLPVSTDPRRNVEGAVGAMRRFALEHPLLSELMFSRPFAAFNPNELEQEAGAFVREFLVEQVQSCIQKNLLSGDPTDIAHNVVALAMGLATQERAGWLGSTPIVRERRWRLGLQGLLNGFAPGVGEESPKDS